MGHIVFIHISAHTSKSKRRSRAPRRSGKERKKKIGVLRFIFAIMRSEMVPGGPRGREREKKKELNYGHIRDFFKLYLLASVKGKKQLALLNWVT